MSDPQHHPVGDRNDGADFLQRVRESNAAVVTDETPDRRLIKNPSNRQKVAEVCRILGRGSDDFDLTVDPDFDRLLRNMSSTSAVAGLYLADMRAQLYGRLKMFEEEAINEWWFSRFDDMLDLLHTGQPPKPKKLH